MDEKLKNEINEKVKNLLFIHKGRINRIDYFCFLLGFNGIQKLLDKETGSFVLDNLLLLISLFFAYLSASIIAKRFRDIGHSGWFALPYFIIASSFAYLAMSAPYFETTKIYWVIGILGLLICGLTLTLWPGDKNDNKYGAYDPNGIMNAHKS